MNAILPAPQKQRIRLAGPLILVSAGALLLLNNLGYLSWDVWWYMLRFWPALVVLAGIQMILRYYGPTWLRIVAPALLIAATVGAAVALTLLSGNVMLLSAASEGLHLQAPLNGLEQGTVNVDFGAGHLLLGSLDRDSDLFFGGDFQNGTNESVRQDFRGENGRGVLSLRTSDGVMFPFSSGRYNEWDVKLTRRLPLNLTIKVGGTESHLDLTDLSVENLSVDVGASKAEIKFPSSSKQTRASINAGLGELDLTIPPNVAAKVRTRGGLVDFSVDSARFTRDGDTYSTGDWEGALQKLDLSIDGGLARIALR